MNDHGYYVMRVRSGTELNTHELLCEDLVLKREGVDVFTPFQMKRQRMTGKRRATRDTPRPFADPLIKGWLIFRTETYAGLARVRQLIDDKPYLYGMLVRSRLMGSEVVVTPYMLPNDLIANWTAPDGMRDNKNKLQSYDPKRDARKNLSRIYAQRATSLPQLTEGEVVRMMEGSFTGIDMTVESVRGDMADLSMMIFGCPRTITADRLDLRKAG